jgi:hypothetical protein
MRTFFEISSDFDSESLCWGRRIRTVWAMVRRHRRRGLCRSIRWDEMECAMCRSCRLRSESSVSGGPSVRQSPPVGAVPRGELGVPAGSGVAGAQRGAIGVTALHVANASDLTKAGTGRAGRRHQSVTNHG